MNNKLNKKIDKINFLQNELNKIIASCDEDNLDIKNHLKLSFSKLEEKKKKLNKKTKNLVPEKTNYQLWWDKIKEGLKNSSHNSKEV